MDIALAGLVFSVSIPLLAFSVVLYKLDSESLSIFRPNFVRGRLRRGMQSKLQLAEEFEFERAIEAYEELIDSTYKQRRA